MWQNKELATILNKPGVHTTRIDQCQYGTSHRNPTNLAYGGGLVAQPHLVATCAPGVRGRCSNTGQPPCSAEWNGADGWLENNERNRMPETFFQIDSRRLQ